MENDAPGKFEADDDDDHADRLEGGEDREDDEDWDDDDWDDDDWVDEDEDATP